jgi:GxxExxY protein
MTDDGASVGLRDSRRIHAQGDGESEEGQRVEALARGLIGHAIAVHRALGPGFSEAVYARAMEIELRQARIAFHSEVSITVLYRGTPVGHHRLDLLVGEQVVLELKALPAIEPVHRAQVLAYLRTSGCRLGYVLNFGAATLGIRRVIL